MSTSSSPSTAAKEPKPKLPSFAESQDMVTIIVGPEHSETKFIIHKSFLIHASPFFNAAFTGGFQEGETQSMRLDDIPVEVFNMVVHWVYQGHLNGSETCSLERLAVLWNTADRFIMPKLQNTAMDILWQRFEKMKCGGSFPKAFLQVVCETKFEDNPVKRLLIKHMAWRESPATAKKLLKEVPFDLLMDIIQEMKHHCYSIVPMSTIGKIGAMQNYHVKLK